MSSTSPETASARRELLPPRRRRRRPNPETALVKACLQILALHQIEAWRQNSGRLITARGQMVTLGRKGAADITGILRPSGRRLEIECKRPGNQPTPEQWRFLREIEEAGGVALVVHSAVELWAKLKGK